MYYYQQHDEDQKQSRIAGAIATGVYFLALALMLLLIRIDQQARETMGEGILMNFGNVEQAAPGGDLEANDEIAQMQSVPQRTQNNQPEALTQDFQEATEIRQPREDRRNTTAPTQPAERPREVNRQALFPGRTVGSAAVSDGTGEGVGNQGHPAGSPDGNLSTAGTGTSGNSASLAGRSLVGSLPRPDYGAPEEGRVIVDITVDQQGKVIAAAYRSVGSTTQNKTLVDAAIKAARQARFNVDENAAINQTGTITYNFRMQ